MRLIFFAFLPLVFGELLDSLPASLLSELISNDPTLAAAGLEAGKLVGSTMKQVESLIGGSSVKDPKLENPLDSLKVPFKSEFESFSGGAPGKVIKAAVPIKKVAVTKAAGAKVLLPKVKVKAALKAKPKVHKLEPIVHVVEKPVPVFHKVPIPKKVIVKKFYPVPKPILVPKIVPVPFKVPIKKIVPKFVKIAKPVPVPKFVKVKKPVPIAIPYPVPKVYKVPIPKPVPYKKYIPIPIPKKVPKFIPIPVKKIIKIPKPYYVPVKVPHVTTSYMKTPMKVKVPDVKKIPFKGKESFKDESFEDFDEKSFLDFIEPEKDTFQFKVADSHIKLAENPEKLV